MRDNMLMSELQIRSMVGEEKKRGKQVGLAIVLGSERPHCMNHSRETTKNTENAK